MSFAERAAKLLVPFSSPRMKKTPMAQFVTGTAMGVAPSFHAVGAACGVEKPGVYPLSRGRVGFIVLKNKDFCVGPKRVSRVGSSLFTV